MNRYRRWAIGVLEHLRDLLGRKCAKCGKTHTKKGKAVQLEFDCIIPQGHEHHEWETNRRAVFYRRQMANKNLQLLCRGCHVDKTQEDLALYPF